MMQHELVDLKLSFTTGELCENDLIYKIGDQLFACYFIWLTVYIPSLPILSNLFLSPLDEPKNAFPFGRRQSGRILNAALVLYRQSVR